MLKTMTTGLMLVVIMGLQAAAKLRILNILSSYRLVPIMLLKLPIMLWSNAPEFYPLCSNYDP